MTLESARAEAERVVRVLEVREPHFTRDHPLRSAKEASAAQTVILESLERDVLGEHRVAAALPMVAAALLLAIACANVASLLLVRGASREREMALRAALGAGRRRLFRQLLVENLLLGLVAAGAGLLVATWGLSAFRAWAPMEMFAPAVGTDSGVVAFSLDAFRLDGRFLAFGVLVSVATITSFGMLPALQGARISLSSALQGAPARGGQILRGSIVCLQVALSFVLLVVAGLLLATFRNLFAVDTGMDHKRIAEIRVTFSPSYFERSMQTLGGTTYPVTLPTPRVAEFIDTVATRLEALDTVDSVLVGGGYSSRISGFRVRAVGLESDPADISSLDDVRRAMHMTILSGDFIRTFGVDTARRPIPLGADGPIDLPTATSRVLVNRAFARKYIPDGSPTEHEIVFDEGRRMAFGARVIR